METYDSIEKNDHALNLACVVLSDLGFNEIQWCWGFEGVGLMMAGRGRGGATRFPTLSPHLVYVLLLFFYIFLDQASETRTESNNVD